MKNLVLSGYALCWDEKAFIEKDWNERFYEQFQRGAFSESIKTGGQKLLLFHKKIYEIANEKEGNLIFLEDEKGLAFRIELPNNSDGRFTYNLVRDGLKHVSVGFRNARVELGEYRHTRLHTVKKADLVEISLLNNPSYKTSTVRTGCDHIRLNMISKINNSLNQ